MYLNACSEAWVYSEPIRDGSYRNEDIPRTICSWTTKKKKKPPWSGRRDIPKEKLEVGTSSVHKRGARSLKWGGNGDKHGKREGILVVS